MNVNVDIHLINRFNVGRQSVSRAIALTSDDKYWCGVEIVDSCSGFQRTSHTEANDSPSHPENRVGRITNYL